MNGLSCSSQSAQFKDFLLRANKYNWLKIVGDDESTDKKLILVEVGNVKHNNSPLKGGSSLTKKLTLKWSSWSCPHFVLKLILEIILFDVWKLLRPGWSTFSTTCESVFISHAFMFTTISSCFCWLDTIRSMTLFFNNLFNVILISFFKYAHLTFCFDYDSSRIFPTSSTDSLEVCRTS